MTTPTTQPANSLPADLRRPGRRRAALACAAGLFAAALLWFEHQGRVLHPVSLPFLFLLLVMIAAALGGLVRGMWRAVRGPRRLVALAWALLAVFPLLFWAAIGAYSFWEHGKRRVSRDLPMTLAKMAGASLMEAQAQYGFPHRLETSRLVMFYDDRVTEAERDAEAMERHVARLEELTGRPLRAKIHWVRGRLLGQGNLAFYGLALGSTESPAGQLDRHELAHAVLYQHDEPDTDPPTLLLEGWAESQSADPATLALSAAAVLRDPIVARDLFEGKGTKGYLRLLTGPGWYHRDRGPVYPVGGALVNFILKKYGVERFLDLYRRARPGAFDGTCRVALGVELDTLEGQLGEELRLADPVGGPAGP